MAKEHPRCSEFTKSDLFTLGDFTWAVSRKIGEGSYGKVYLGWTKGNKGSADIAVKYIRKEHLQDAKVCQNMQREIKILHALSDCKHVVRLYKDIDHGGDLILFMELCDGDLDARIQKTPFNCSETKLFLSEMADGMRVLRERHVVHRDLKPQNILIKTDPLSGKMQFKIADFGFARFFKEESTKDVNLDMMYSLAGTPVFMAPEALRCVITHGKTPYDEKVDLWSIGALLYKCLVGHCGFFAHLNQIVPILEKKKDAIAFVRPKKVGEKIRYVYEFPQEVQDRLPRDFCVQVTTLLKELLKVHPEERLSFEEFFSRVEELTKNNVELIDAVFGDVQRVNLSRFTRTSEFTDYVSEQFCVPPEKFVLFSEKAKWLAIPSSTTNVDMSLLSNHQLGESDPVVYVIQLNNKLDSKSYPSLLCVEKAADLLLSLPHLGSVVEPLKRILGSTPNGLATLQRRQLKGLRAFWLFVMSKYRQHASNLMRTEKKLAEFLGSSVASVDSLRLCVNSLRNICARDDETRAQTEMEVNRLENLLPELSQKLSQFGDCMESLASYSIDDFTYVHQEFESELQSLRNRISTLGNVDLSQINDAYKAFTSDVRCHVLKVKNHVEEGFDRTVQFLRMLEDAISLVNPLEEQFNDVARQASVLLQASFQSFSDRLSDVTMKGETVVIEVAKTQDSPPDPQPPTNAADCDKCPLKDDELRRKEEEIAKLQDKLLSGTEGDSKEVSVVESTLTGLTVQEADDDIEKTMDILIEKLKTAISDKTPPSSLEGGNSHPTLDSFVVCGDDSGKGLNAKLVEMQELLKVCQSMKNNSHLLSQTDSYNQTDCGSYVKISSDYNPGDLVLFMPTKDPGIHVAVSYSKERIFLDKDSLKNREEDFKRASIPGTPFIVCKVMSEPQSVQSTLRDGNYMAKRQSFILKCEPYKF